MRCLLCCIGFVWLIACAMSSRATAEFELILPKEGDQIVLPCEIGAGYLFCRTKVNGKDAGWFVVDTGFTYSFIDRFAAERLGLVTQTPFAMLGIMGDDSYFASQTRVHTIDLSAIHVKCRRLYTHDFTQWSKMAGLRVSGVIGQDILSQTPITIDYVEPSVTFHRREQFKMPTEGWAVDTKTGTPMIEWPFDEESSYPLVVDTGASGGILVNPGYGPARDRMLAGKTMAANYTYVMDMGHQDAIETVMTFKGGKLPFPVTTIVDVTLSPNRPARRDGLIGSHVLRQFRTTIDMQSKRLWLTPQTRQPQFPKKDEVDKRDLAGLTPLMRAMDHGEVKLVKRLIEAGADVKVKNHLGKTALYLAAQEPHPAITHLLLDAGAKPDFVSPESGRTVLHVACVQNDASVVERLLKTGVNAKAKTKNGETPLHYAGFGGSVKIGKLLLEAGLDINQGDFESATPLHYAARWGHGDFIDFLLANGANPNAMSKDRSTPFNTAVWRGHENAALKLLPLTKDINAGSYEGGTPLMFASFNGNETLVRMLLEKGAKVDVPDHKGNSPLITAVSRGHEGVVKQLLAAGCDVNHLGQGRTTALMHACKLASPNIAQLLIEHKADVHAVDEQDSAAPIIFAAAKGNVPVIELLLKKGVKVDTRTRSNGTPLMYATYGNQIEAVKFLLKHGADVNAVNDNHASALMTAIATGRAEIADLLLKHGADVEQKDKLERSVIHYAAIYGYVPILERLLKTKIRLDTKMSEGIGVMHVAARIGDAKVVKMLLDAGAAANPSSTKPFRPIDLARKHGYPDVVQLLEKATQDKPGS